MSPLRRALPVVVLILMAGGAAIIESRAQEQPQETRDGREVELRATKPEFEKIPIGVLDFQGSSAQERLPDDATQILQDDLKRSQVFSLVELPPSVQHADSDGVSDHAMATRAIALVNDRPIDALSWGTMEAANQELKLEAYAYDFGSKRVVLGKRYRGAHSAFRLMVHRWADELVYHYTGRRGIASTKISFVSEHEGGRELFVMDYDGHRPRQITADGFLNLMPTWTPDRKSLVFTAYRGLKQDIVQLDLQSGSRRILVSGDASQRGMVTLEGLNITPALSPDGNKLAFASTQDGNSEVFVLDLRTKQAQRMTFHSAGDLSPSWSPTGRELAFTSDRGGGPQIYLMNADGSDVRRLTFKGDYNAAPAWSPQGDWIAHVCRTGRMGFKLCLTTPDGQRHLQITSGSGIDDSPSWAPDGQHLVFGSTRDGSSHIYMINIDGTGLEQLTTDGTHHSSPSWSPV